MGRRAHFIVSLPGAPFSWVLAPDVAVNSTRAFFGPALRGSEPRPAVHRRHVRSLGAAQPGLGRDRTVNRAVKAVPGFCLPAPVSGQCFSHLLLPQGWSLQPPVAACVIPGALIAQKAHTQWSPPQLQVQTPRRALNNSPARCTPDPLIPNLWGEGLLELAMGVPAAIEVEN